MSHAHPSPLPPDAAARERSGPWIAGAASLLLHLVLLLIAMLAPTPTLTPPQGASSGSVVQVDFIGETGEDAQRIPSPPPTAPSLRERSERSPPQAQTRSVPRLQTTPVPLADTPPPQPAPQPPRASPRPSPSPGEAAPSASQRASAASMPRRHPGVRGQPPGLIVEEIASEGPGLAPSPVRSQGNQREPAPDAPSMAVGGYHVFYDLSSERRLAEWRDQGMTELFIPLPGIRQYMVCPLETALRRGSGECRLMEPNDPGLQAIGDAREVIRVMQVHRRGELLWRGPGAYR